MGSANRKHCFHLSHAVARFALWQRLWAQPVPQEQAKAHRSVEWPAVQHPWTPDCFVPLLLFWKDGWSFLRPVASRAEPAPGSDPTTVGSHGNRSAGPAERVSVERLFRGAGACWSCSDIRGP